MTKRRPGHLSYLLRVWQTGSAGNVVWRASLENPFTGERRGFASLKDLFAFLQAQIDDAASRKVERDDGDKRVKEKDDCELTSHESEN